MVIQQRRSSRGSVDWNLKNMVQLLDWKVAPLVGAWIEINIVGDSSPTFWSLLSWERGLKFIEEAEERGDYRRSSRGSVDWNSYYKDNNKRSWSRSSRGSVDWNLK